MALFVQGPSSSRSVTATSVHPLALEHTAILRAHFSITGRILRTTVLRDQKTGATLLGSIQARLVGSRRLQTSPSSTHSQLAQVMDGGLRC